MKKTSMALVALFAVLSAVPAKADCQQAYFERMATNGISFSSQSLSGLELASYYIAAGAGAGALAAGLIAVGLPVATIGTFMIIDHVQDAHLLAMVRTLDKATWVTGAAQPPQYRTDFVEVNGATAKERRAQRRHNRQVNRDNKEIHKELTQADADFARLLADVQAKVPGVTAQELATAIVTSNTSDEFCNGLIGHDGAQLVLQNYVAEVGPTPAELKAQKKQNRRIERANRHAERKYNRDRFANEQQAAVYFSERLH